MRVLYARCAGLDVHKATIVACLLLTATRGKTSREIRTFATTTAGLLALADWLVSQQVSHVAMESTGIFWRPVFNILQGRFQVILVNAAHMKAVPGHKVRREVAWLIAPERKLSGSLLFHQQYSWAAKREGNHP